MINLAVTFLVITIFATVFGFGSIASAATGPVGILYVVGLVIALILFLTGRKYI